MSSSFETNKGYDKVTYVPVGIIMPILTLQSERNHPYVGLYRH